MPFKSKAQIRYMFANHPRIAKRWAKKQKGLKNLPEKKMEKKGRYFGIPIKAKQLVKFMGTGNTMAARKINVADNFTSSFLGGKNMKLTMPKAFNPKAGNKTWPMK